MLRINLDVGTGWLDDNLDDWQRADFEALDPACLMVIDPSRFNFEGAPRRAYLERPRGHAKTTGVACRAETMLFASKRRLLGVVAAGDRDQAALLTDAIASHCQLNPHLAQVLDVQREKVIAKHTGSELRVLTSDAPTSYGLTPDFIICDELTHWAKPGLWHSLLSSAAKKPHCLLLVIANAGFGKGTSWQWEAREACRLDPGWYFHRLDGPVASWIRPELLEEQRRHLPEIAWRRLWLNSWTTGSGDAIEEKLIDGAVTLDGPAVGPEPGVAWSLGVDLGLKHDATALCLVGRHVGWMEKKPVKPRPLTSTMKAMIEMGHLAPPRSEPTTIRHDGTNRFKLAKVRTWKPVSGQTVDVEAVEETILAWNQRFRLSAISADTWQAAYLIERLQKRGLPAEGIAQTGNVLQEMAQTTLDAFRESQIDLFDDRDLIADMKALRVAEKSYGFRLVAPRQAGDGAGTRHADTATALQLALYGARAFRPVSEGIEGRKLVLSMPGETY